jgi:16S rRNA (adenine1518-N6/adenine1519-N6)-dimethyltransferase
MNDSFTFTKIQIINQFMKENNAAPLKKWGQNFLIDKNIIESIILQLPLDSVLDLDCIVEIGPGLGSITHRLVEFNKDIVLFEIDPILIENLKKYNYDQPPFVLVEGDVLSNLEIVSNKKFFCFGNLPYYISTDILTSLMSTCPGMKSGIFMLQKEFIHRVTKENSSISIFLNCFGEWKHIRNVSASCFYPSPKAESALVHYKKDEVPKLDPKETIILQIILRSFFWGKRKMISKNIKESPFLEKWDRKKIYEIITRDGFLSGKERAEDIPKEIYYTLSKNISNENLTIL